MITVKNEIYCTRKTGNETNKKFKMITVKNEIYCTRKTGNETNKKFKMITVKNEIYCNEKIFFSQYNLIEHRRNNTNVAK